MTIGPVELLAFLGIALTALLAWPRLRQAGATKQDLLDLALAAIVGGALGARLFYFLPLWIRGEIRFASFLEDWSDGSAYFGGLAGGLAAIGLILRIKKLPVWTAFDAISVPVPLGFAAGKVGCFLAGCCYGPLWGSGVSFKPGSLCFAEQKSAGLINPEALSSLPVHPTQLYELLFAAALFGALVMIRRRSKTAGVTTVAYLAAYAVGRFFAEFLRDDPGRRGFGAGILTDSQITAIAVIIAAVVVMGFRTRSRPTDPRRHPG